MGDAGGPEELGGRGGLITRGATVGRTGNGSSDNAQHLQRGGMFEYSVLVNEDLIPVHVRKLRSGLVT